MTGSDFLQIQKGSYGVKLKAEFSGMTDECKPARILTAVEPAISLGAGRCGQEADLFIVSDGRYFYAA